MFDKYMYIYIIFVTEMFFLVDTSFPYINHFGREHSKTQWYSSLNMKQELLTFREHMDSPPDFWWVRIPNRFTYLSCIFCLVCFVLCLANPILPVSLDCPFLVAPSVFPNVYLFYFINNINYSTYFLYQHFTIYRKVICCLHNLIASAIIFLEFKFGLKII